MNTGKTNLLNRDNCQGRGKIRTVTKKKDEVNFTVSANIILFVNRGQNHVLLDDQILIGPGGHHKETNVCHDYKWRFIENTAPPSVNKPLVYNGNHLSIRIGNAPPGTDMDIYTDNQGAAILSSGNDAPTDITLTATNDTIDTDFTVPALSVYVKIRNVGGLAPAVITVNGNEVTPGGIFERQLFWDGVNRYLLPAYDVVTNGSLVEFYYETIPLI